MNESQAIDVFAALAHETRLRIVRHLVVKGASGNSAGGIGEVVNAAPSKITFHISALERAGLVSSEKVSRQIIYRVNFDQMGALLTFLMRDCCNNDASVLATCGCKPRR
jgi:DNA-binding transcriptional ArsR family regulator